MKSNPIPFEVPWLAVKDAGHLKMFDKAGYDTWLNQAFGDGERAMILVLPLVADTPAYHAAAFRYYWAAVLPLIAEEIGEANLEDAHDQLARMFLPAHLISNKRKRNGLAVKRASTSMAALPCDAFCEFLDRVIGWATHPDGLGIEVPMADRAWKWKQERRGTGSVSRGLQPVVGVPEGEKPSVAPEAGR